MHMMTWPVLVTITPGVLQRTAGPHSSCDRKFQGVLFSGSCAPLCEALLGFESRLSGRVIDLSWHGVMRSPSDLGPFRRDASTVICEALDLVFAICGLTARALWLCYSSEILLIPKTFGQDQICESRDADLRRVISLSLRGEATSSSDLGPLLLSVCELEDAGSE
jgi:hypothetical protein